MSEIKKIKKITLLIFFIPVISINVCLLISTNSSFLDNTFFIVDQIGRSAFTIPYLDGSLSISRASRTFPQYLIFKPSMFVTSLILVMYWKLNNDLINKFEQQKNKLNYFMIFGVLSAVFLIIHALLLGIEYDIKIFKFFRRVVLLSFIIFEILAQSFLVYKFYKLKFKMYKFFNLNILKIKIILVTILIVVAILSIPILATSGNVHFKHALEWNYFIGVVLFYLLTRFFWKKI